MTIAARVLLASTVSIVLLLAGCKTAPPPRKASGTDLFNGKNFDGWTFCMKNNADPMQTWSVSDGVMHCTGKPLGYIRTTDTSHDYKLTCVWRFVKLDPNSKKNNTGILVHIQLPDVVFPECVQCQGLLPAPGRFDFGRRRKRADGHQAGKNRHASANRAAQ